MRRLRGLGVLGLGWALLLGVQALLASHLAAGEAATVALATGEGLIGVGLLVVVRLLLYLVLPPLAVFTATRALLAGYSPSQRPSTPPS
jgi:hypothetical protein